jgi:hypothetical protein
VKKSKKSEKKDLNFA